MIIKGRLDPNTAGRTVYPLGGAAVVRHFVVRETTPGHPFAPHSDPQPELWFVLEGDGTLSLAGEERPVGPGDLIRIDPGVEHGLRAEAGVRWICMG